MLGIVITLLLGLRYLEVRHITRKNLLLERDIEERKRNEEILRKAHAEVERLKNRLQEENIYLREEIKIEHNFEEIISCSEALNNVLRKVEEVAVTDATVLISGETGTGVFWRICLAASPRR